MAKPKPLTRKELAEFLPNLRAIRTFEQLFNVVPADVTQLFLFVESALLQIESLATEVEHLRQKQYSLELAILTLNNGPDPSELQKRIELIESWLNTPNTINLDPLTKRVEILETLQG